MDPFSIAAGCVGFSESVGRTVPIIISFVRAVHGARGELDKICEQLKRLELVLKRIQQTIGPKEQTPDEDRDFIFMIINECLEATDSINTIIKDYHTWWGPSRWALHGKDKCQLVSKNLDQCIRDLDLVIQGHQSTVLDTLVLQNDHSTLQSNLIQQNICKISGDTDYLKRQASEHTSILATLSQRISHMFNLVDRTNTLPCDEDVSWASDGTQRRISSDSESIFRDLHCATAESEENHLTKNYDSNVSLGTDQLSVTEPLEWRTENCSFVSSANLLPYAEASGTPCQKPSMVIKSPGRSAESSIVVKFKTDVHAMARAFNSSGTQVPSSSPRHGGKDGTTRCQNGGFQSDHLKRRSMVVNDFQRQVRESIRRC